MYLYHKYDEKKPDAIKKIVRVLNVTKNDLYQFLLISFKSQTQTYTQAVTHK